MVIEHAFLRSLRCCQIHSSSYIGLAASLEIHIYCAAIQHT